jgi:hypothetical protein
MLSTDEIEAIWPLTIPLPAGAREPFLLAVSSALNGSACQGPGAAYRVARALLPRYFIPPPPDKGPVTVRRRRA